MAQMPFWTIHEEATYRKAQTLLDWKWCRCTSNQLKTSGGNILGGGTFDVFASSSKEYKCPYDLLYNLQLLDFDIALLKMTYVGPGLQLSQTL